MKYKNEISGVGILIFMWLMVAISSLLVIIKSTEIIGVYVLIGFGLTMTLIYIPTLKKTLKIRKNYQNIIAKGIKVKGHIVNYIHNTYKIASTRISEYSVVVTFIDPYINEERTITTPALSHNVVRYLGDTTCSVYILNNEYYVTDFIPRAKGQSNIWYGEKIDILEQKELKKIFIFTTVFILIFILVCLLCMGVIKL